MDQVIKKLSFCKKLLKEWSKKTLPNNQRQIDELVQKAEELQDNNATVQDYGKIREINDQLK